MVRRGEITDRAWRPIEPLLPEYGRSGGRRRDHRQVVNGILWKLRTGSPWPDLPERYGPRQTCFDRFDRRRRDGTWDRLLAHAQTKSDAVGEGEWEVSVDDTVIRAHQHAAGARGAGRPKGTQKGAPEPRRRGPGAQPRRFLDEAAPRLRRQGPSALGGRDARTAPREHAAWATPRRGTRVARPAGRAGRPRERPRHVIADRGYSFEGCRRLLRRRGISHTIPERKDQRERRRGRPPKFGRKAYRRRNVVERCVNRLKQWRGLATKYEKRAAI